MKSILLGGCLLGLAVTAGCGSGSTTDEGVGGSSAGASSTGGVSSGGTSAGGTSSGGSGESGTGGGATDGGFCSPGITVSAGFYPYPIDTCGKVDGITDNTDVAYRDITLETPIGPGDTYAFSAHMDSPPGKFEIWGAMEKCGSPGELLDSFDNTQGGTICLEAKPTTGTYSHLIWVWYVGANQLETRFCEGGTCPAK